MDPSPVPSAAKAPALPPAKGFTQQFLLVGLDGLIRPLITRTHFFGVVGFSLGTLLPVYSLHRQKVFTQQFSSKNTDL
jgi:hypothetical protein